MSDTDLNLCIYGPQSQSLAREIADAFEEHLGSRPTQKEVAASGPPVKAVDPLAIVAIFLAFPSAVVAADDIAERLDLNPKIDALLEKVGEILRRKPDNEVELMASNGEAVNLKHADPARIINMAAHVVRKKRP